MVGPLWEPFESILVATQQPRLVSFISWNTFNEEEIRRHLNTEPLYAWHFCSCCWTHYMEVDGFHVIYQSTP